MKENLTYSSSAHSRMGRTVAHAVSIAPGRPAARAWAEEADKEPVLERRQEERDKKQVLLELWDLQWPEELERPVE